YAHYFIRLVFVMTRRPPVLPLLPYTTLFRSPLGRALGDDPHGGVVQLAEAHAGLRGREGRVGGLAHGFVDLALDRREGAAHGDRDRKSTRLNSSHVKISYAVFCLKKKTKDS